MPHAPRTHLRAHRIGRAFLFASLLLVSCGGPEPVPFEPTDAPELASFAATPASGSGALEVAFSWDLRGGDAICRIDVDGDGAHERELPCATGAHVHTYDEAGTYRAELWTTGADRSVRTATTVTVAAGAPSDDVPDDGATDPSGDAATPFGAARDLGAFPAALPYRYDRMVASDDHALVGVPSDPTSDDHAGSVIVHARGDDGSWNRAGVLEPPDDGVEAFGEHLALDGDVLAVTADRRDPARGAREAVVYLYELGPDGGWLPTRTLLEGEGVRPGSLTLALRDGLLALGHRASFAVADAPGGGFDVGVAVRIFERDAGGPSAWGETEPILAPARDDGRDGSFGADVDVAPGGTLLAVVDAAQRSDEGFGARVHLFERGGPGAAWTRVRTIADEELPSPYSAMVEVDEDTLVVAPMALRETVRAEVVVFERDRGGTDAWGRAAAVAVEVGLDEEKALPRDVLLATGFAGDVVAVGIGPSTCMDLRDAPASGPVPCAGGRVHLLGPDGAGGWAVRHVVEDPGGATQSSYGEYVALAPGGGALLAGGVVIRDDGTAYTRADLYLRER